MVPEQEVPRDEIPHEETPANPHIYATHNDGDAKMREGILAMGRVLKQLEQRPIVLPQGHKIGDHSFEMSK